MHAVRTIVSLVVADILNTLGLFLGGQISRDREMISGVVISGNMMLTHLVGSGRGQPAGGAGGCSGAARALAVLQQVLRVAAVEVELAWLLECLHSHAQIHAILKFH